MLTVSRRFEFAASRRLHLKGLSAKDNLIQFGPENVAEFGSGRNFEVWVNFEGEIDQPTGMMINLADLKSKVLKIIDQSYDHKFLNLDNIYFKKCLPTPENVALSLALDIDRIFATESLKLSSLVLNESDERGAIVASDRSVSSLYKTSFSAARQTMSPHMSLEENERMFGIASSEHGHGHNYKLEFNLEGEPDPETGLIRNHEICRRVIGEIKKEFDHRNLNKEVEGLNGYPVTTEYLGKYIYNRIASNLPTASIRLNETDEFFVESDKLSQTNIGLIKSFHSAHRLHSDKYSDSENLAIYGKCNNLNGHGHTYKLETLIKGQYDPRSGTVCNLEDIDEAISSVLKQFDNKHLDLEVAEFKNRPSTGENIVAILWDKLKEKVPGELVRLRLYETNNNCFTAE